MIYLKENYKKILPYTGIFFVLLMGSGLVKIPVGSVLFYVIKFGIIAAVLGIGISAWRRAKLRNETPTDYLKLALFVPFTIDFHLHYAFIFLTIILFNKKLLLPWNSPLKPIYLLFIWGFISYVINQFIEFNPLSFPLFIWTFFLPFIFFSLSFIYRSENVIKAAANFFINAILIMSAIIILQILFLRDVHPDFWSGGTQNAHAAAALMTLGFILVLFDLLKGQINLSKIKSYFLLVAAPLLFYYMDAKVFLIFIFFYSILTLFLHFAKSKTTRILFISFSVIAVFVWLFIFKGRIPISTLTSDSETYTLISVIGNYSEMPKAKLFTEYFKLPFSESVMFFVGSGPGTFISRASLLKYHISNGGTHLSITGEREKLIIPYSSIFYPVRTNVQNKFANIYDAERHESFYNKKSTIFSVLFELGLIGFILLCWFFIKRLKEFNSKKKIVIFALVLLTLFISYFNYWLEQTSFTIALYSLLGMNIPDNINTNNIND